MVMAKGSDAVLHLRWTDLLDVHRASSALFLSRFIHHAEGNKVLSHLWTRLFWEAHIVCPAHHQGWPMDEQHW